jgi:hypothetical protein
VALQHFGALQFVQRLLGIAGSVPASWLAASGAGPVPGFRQTAYRQFGNFGLKEVAVQHAHHHAHGFIILIQQFLHQHDAILACS